MHSDERRRRISDGVKRAVSEGRYKRGGWKHTEEWKRAIAETHKAAWRDKLMAEEFNGLSLQRKRSRIMIEQNGACASCGLTEWLGKPIALELDHKKPPSESRVDLWCICPNCHSQTDTWRRSKQSRRFVTLVTDDALLAALKEEPTIRKALVRVGLKGEGSNYERARALLL